jgi:carbonic anhydrase
MRVAWLSLLFLLAAAEAPAAKWVSIAEGSARAVYLDSEALQRDGTTVHAWTREVYMDEQRSAHIGVLYYSANSRIRFDCAKRTMAPTTRVFYGGDGTELRRVSLDAVELPALVAPGSVQEHLLNRACLPPTERKAAQNKRGDSEPSDGPTKVALADTKPRTDVPAAVDAQKSPAPPVANPASPEPAKRAAPASNKPVVPQTAPPKVVACKPDVPAVHRPYVRAPLKLALAKCSKKDTRNDEHERVPWGYDGKGAPQSWGELKPEFAACGEGKQQSPIDIQEGARLDLEPIKFDYRPAPLRIIDNGHTVQVNYAEGSSITVSGVRYDLKQFHFHKPSEERVNGKAYDMVVHLVHQSADGRLAVVAVLMEAGPPNPFIASLWPSLPLEPGREFSQPEVVVDLNNLLPDPRSYYAYMGSLTTPPCTEGVLWLVLKTPVSVASDQVGIFGKLYSMNARPVQPANGRLIKESL